MSLLQSNKVLKGDAPRLGRQPSSPKSSRQDNVTAVIRLADSYAVFTGRGGRALMQKNRESLSRDLLLQIVADREQRRISHNRAFLGMTVVCSNGGGSNGLGLETSVGPSGSPVQRQEADHTDRCQQGDGK